MIQKNLLSCSRLPRHVLAALLCTVVARAQTEESSSEKPVELSVFEVSATADHGYSSSESTSASRVKQDINSIPATIGVVNAELIKDLAAANLAETLRFAAGVFTTEAEDESVQIRGFNVAIPLSDGFREPVTRPSESAHIDRVEVLMGPASLLYGNNFGVGGIVNRVTKQARLDRSQGSLTATIRNNDWYQSVLDLTGPINAAKTLGYRFVMDGLRSGGLQDFAKQNRIFLRPSVLWRPTQRTSLAVAFSYFDQNTIWADKYDYWQSDTKVQNRFIVTDERFNPNENLRKLHPTKYSLNTQLVHDFNSSWHLRHAIAGSIIRDRTDQLQIGRVRAFNANYNKADGTTAKAKEGEAWLQRNYTYSDRTVYNLFSQLDLAGDFDIANVHNSVLLGVEASQDVDGRYVKTGVFPDIDLNNPAYYLGDPLKVVFSRRNSIHTTDFAGYFNEQAQFFDRKLIFTAGARVNRYVQTSRVENATGMQPKGRLEGDPHFTPRYGVVYKVTPTVSLYGGYSEAFVVITNTNPDGSAFKPVTGEQYEAGIKGTIFSGKLNGGISYFDLTQAGVLQADPLRPGYQVQSNEQASKGVDVSLAASPFKGLDIIASYERVTAQTERDIDPTAVGSPLVGVPKNQLKLWAKYRVPSGRLKGLNFGAGVSYVDERFAGALRMLPSYQLYDCMVAYARKDWRAALNIKNLTNERYYVSGDDFKFRYGEPKQVVFTLSRSF